jgi:hypothetical protein
MLGSGAEVTGTAGLAGDVAGNLSDLTTQQALEESNLQREAAGQNFRAQQDYQSRQQQYQQMMIGLIQSMGGLY